MQFRRNGILFCFGNGKWKYQNLNTCSESGIKQLQIYIHIMFYQHIFCFTWEYSVLTNVVHTKGFLIKSKNFKCVLLYFI